MRGAVTDSPNIPRAPTGYRGVSFLAFSHRHQRALAKSFLFTQDRAEGWVYAETNFSTHPGVPRLQLSFPTDPVGAEVKAFPAAAVAFEMRV